MKATLAKALKIKNRLTENIAEMKNNIKQNNTVLKDGIRKVDVRKTAELHTKAIEALAALKYEIYKANEPIQEDIFRLSELKSEIIMWDKVNCDEGKVEDPDRFFTTKEGIEKTTLLTFKEIQAIRKKLEKQIIDIQDKLDNYNYKTTITIPDSISEILK